MPQGTMMAFTDCRNAHENESKRLLLQCALVLDSAVCQSNTGLPGTERSCRCWRKFDNEPVSRSASLRSASGAHSYVSRIEKDDRRLDVPEMIQ